MNCTSKTKLNANEIIKIIGKLRTYNSEFYRWAFDTKNPCNDYFIV